MEPKMQKRACISKESSYTESRRGDEREQAVNRGLNFLPSYF